MERAGRRRVGGVTDPLGERWRRGGVLDLDMDLVKERFAGDGDLDLRLCPCFPPSRPRGTYESLALPGA